MEYWVWKIGGMGKRRFRFPMKVLTNSPGNDINPSFHAIIFHYSIIPVWNKKDGCLRISYYQGFVEFPIELIT
jgi:hypothetical protein